MPEWSPGYQRLYTQQQIKIYNDMQKQSYIPLMQIQSMRCILIKKKIIHIHLHGLHCHALGKSPAPGIMKFTIVVDPFLVNITGHLVSLNHAPRV